VQNLEAKVLSQPSPEPAAAPAEAPAADEAPAPGPRKITQSEPVEAVNLLSATGTPVLKRLAPVAAVIAAVIILWRVLS